MSLSECVHVKTLKGDSLLFPPKISFVWFKKNHGCKCRADKMQHKHSSLMYADITGIISPDNQTAFKLGSKFDYSSCLCFIVWDLMLIRFTQYWFKQAQKSHRTLMQQHVTPHENSNQTHADYTASEQHQVFTGLNRGGAWPHVSEIDTWWQFEQNKPKIFSAILYFYV